MVELYHPPPPSPFAFLAVALEVACPTVDADVGSPHEDFLGSRFPQTIAVSNSGREAGGLSRCAAMRASRGH